MLDYYLQTWYIGVTSIVAERIKTYDLNPTAFSPMGGLDAHTRKKKKT